MQENTAGRAHHLLIFPNMKYDSGAGAYLPPPAQSGKACALERRCAGAELTPPHSAPITGDNHPPQYYLVIMLCNRVCAHIPHSFSITPGIGESMLFHLPLVYIYLSLTPFTSSSPIGMSQFKIFLPRIYLAMNFLSYISPCMMFFFFEFFKKLNNSNLLRRESVRHVFI